MALTPEEARELARLERLAVWLDTKYETPFGIRVGWDGILGLVPVVGEIVTTLISGYLIVRAAWLGASTPVLLRMGLNVVIDDVIAVVPLVGWIGDFVWKSNVKNTDLLRKHLADPETTRRRSLAVVIVSAAVVVAAVATFALLVGIAAWILGSAVYRMATQGF
ncbi:MAG: DUF4112 domain-containing protein [Bdellovibrionales bacterium]|nr:DUF4112 domain-containing protein [Bdellovibrionales bacterium]